MEQGHTETAYYVTVPINTPIVLMSEISIDQGADLKAIVTGGSYVVLPQENAS